MNPLPPPDHSPPAGPLSRIIGRSRFIVLLAVIAVLLVAISLFLFGTLQAATSIWHAWADTLHGQAQTSRVTLAFLEIVRVMLEAVVFFLVGVGLYSLFIAPLNVTVALGVESLDDLEDRIISLVVAILATTFLEHFIQWQKPLETLEFGGALSAVVIALVLFQMAAHRAKEDQKQRNPEVQVRAQREMFENATEEHALPPVPEGDAPDPQE